MIESKQVSVIIPARDEGTSLETLLPDIREILPECELILVNDGSTDDTKSISKKYADVLINHPVSLGNGAAIKSGGRSAKRKVLVFMDGDGQHNPADIPELLKQLDEGNFMAIGARDPSSHASIFRRIANFTYNKLSSYITGHQIKDLTSGFRAVYKKPFTDFIDLLPNGFSYPTTITMAFFKAGYPVTYVPIYANKRRGQSHIRPLMDGARFFLIIFKVGALYSPLKIFAPASALLFATACTYYGYTYITDGRFTNMSALLFISSALTFFIGLVSEQVTQLLYVTINSNNRR